MRSAGTSPTKSKTKASYSGSFTEVSSPSQAQRFTAAERLQQHQPRSGSLDGKSLDIDFDPQPRCRLGTLSEIRQRTSSVSNTNRSTRRAVPARDSIHAISQASREEQPDTQSRRSSAIPMTPSSDTMLSARGSDAGYSALSSMQREVLRQITLDATSIAGADDIPIATNSYFADLAILERKWSNVAMAQNIRVMKEMLAKTPSIINRADFIFGFTALHWAAKLENSRMVDVLLRHGAGVNPIASNGCTPLHIASRLGHERIIQQLCRAGADCDIRNYAGQQPKDLAVVFMSEDTRDLLYAGLRRTLSLNFGRPLTAHERSAAKHLVPGKPDKGGLKPRNDKFSLSGHLKRRFSSRPGSATEVSSVPSNISIVSGRNSDSATLVNGYAEGQLSPLPYGMSLSAGQRVTRNLPRRNHHPGRYGLGQDALGLRDKRLPMSWVPAVRKRALEVEFNDIDDIISKAEQASLAVTDPMSPTTNAAMSSSPELRMLDDIPVIVGQDPTPGTSPIPVTKITSPDRSSDA